MCCCPARRSTEMAWNRKLFFIARPFVYNAGQFFNRYFCNGVTEHGNPTPLRKSSRLKAMLNSPHLEYFMEAHNGLTAKVVQETGFKGIWASGLSISAQWCIRDSNEASWTQVLDLIEFMSDATDIPILLDADTGYGNFNNARRLVQKLESREIAGACMEDKIFPKTNSLHEGRMQPLADMEEFALKIKACKDAQKDPDFCIVARVEAFIAGWGLDEALRRAEAYRNAGADAILMHSKRNDSTEIEEFMRAWKNQGPVIIVPTNYYNTPTDHFHDLGISCVIWANHNLRAALSAIQHTSRQIYEEKSLKNVEQRIASVKDIFRLQNEDELVEAEKQYLPVHKKEKEEARTHGLTVFNY